MVKKQTIQLCIEIILSTPFMEFYHESSNLALASK